MMAVSRLAVAQRGVALADAVPGSASLRRRRAKSPRARAGAGRRPRAASPLVGPFLSPGALTAAERLRLIDGIERVLEGVYTHLPLKRARYGFDPVQRLRILRSQIAELSDDAFHLELADTITRLRDAHTRYTGPAALESKVAALPFLVEMIGSVSAPTYVVTKVGHSLDASFKPGVVLEYWNGVPIDRAVQRHGEQEVGGRPDSQRAWAVQSLTLRSLQYGPPPDEHWVIVGYRTAAGAAGQSKEIKLPWQVVDPSEISPLFSGGPTGSRAKALRRTRAVNPAAEAIRRAKMLLFAPHALTGSQAKAPKAQGKGLRRAPTAGIIPTALTETLKAMTIEAPGGPFGYLRIYGFDAAPQPFIEEIIRLIEPTRFSALATPFTRQIASIGDVAEDLAPWKRSLDAAVRNGELYAQTIPITDPDACNALGQMYGGPLILVADSTTYSSGDLFSAGFVDNQMGPFICVGSATGAGGANVWSYGELRQALAGSPAALPALPDGIDMSLSFRRATRARGNEGIPIEDVGVSGTTYAMTLDDLLNGNPDLIATCIAALEAQPFSRLTTTVDTAARTIEVKTAGLDLVDAKFDGHSGVTVPVDAAGVVTITYPPHTTAVELAGCLGPDTRQRRRLSLRP